MVRVFFLLLAISFVGCSSSDGAEVSTMGLARSCGEAELVAREASALRTSMPFENLRSLRFEESGSEASHDLYYVFTADVHDLTSSAVLRGDFAGHSTHDRCAVVHRRITALGPAEESIEADDRESCAYEGLDGSGIPDSSPRARKLAAAAVKAAFSPAARVKNLRLTMHGIQAPLASRVDTLFHYTADVDGDPTGHPCEIATAPLLARSTS
jgi:hypothetical protein